MREIHRNLHGGKGLIKSHTCTIRLFGNYVQFIKLTLDCGASIGMHAHPYNSEIYFTFNPCIRFSGLEDWTMFNFCKRGNTHGAINHSLDGCANIYAIKF